MPQFIFITFLFLLPKSIFALECPEGQFPVSAHPRTSYYRTNGTFVNSSNVELYCKEYTFSKPIVLKYLSNIPEGWPYQLELFKKWEKEDKKEIEKAIKSLPKSLQNLGEIKLYRAIKSSFQDNPSTAGPDESIIVFYDGAKKYGFKKVLAHELAHILYSKLNKNERKNYHETAEWDIQNGSFTTVRKIFSESDGKLGPEEDFANNIEHILTDKNYQNVMSKKIVNCLLSILGMKK